MVNADGTDETNVTNTNAGDTFPAWSPTGDKIAFLTYGGAGEIFVMNADGTNSIRLTDSYVRLFAGHFAWSPDGTRIAFSRFSTQEGNLEIYVVNVDGSDPSR